MNNNFTILGIDPGYGRLGWAVGQLSSQSLIHPKIIGFGCIQTQPKQKIGLRYQKITNQIEEICKKFQPDVLAIEKLYFSRNTTTALQTSEARGLVFAVCLQYVHQIIEYSPSNLKLAVTGNGHANKSAVEKMIRLQLNLPSDTIIDDTIDALGLVLTHAVTHSTLQGNENQVIL
jgi:crossover junction endodeoxyribonuclease RuvC